MVSRTVGKCGEYFNVGSRAGDDGKHKIVPALQTKDDYRKLMMDILEPLIPYYSEGCARLRLGVTATNYDEASIELEAFSRPLWALVPFWAGGGRDTRFEEIYLKGLINGTDPASPEYWGGFHAFDQRFVEMAAIAYGLILAPQFLWDPMTEAQRQNLANWLNGINEYELPDCNWVLFAVLVNIALKKRGARYDAAKLEKYLKGADTFYLGDGWYRDGDSNQKDYYVSFAIHFYSLFYASVMEADDPERCRIYKERANEFAKTFIYWFDEEGRALPFGRSLTYRYAQVSFFSACLMAGVTPDFTAEDDDSIAVMKGLISRHLLDWMKRPIFDRDHVLTIGYGYPNLVMAERYNGPGSAYWSMKTFAVLMLPDEHPFWSAECAPMPKLEVQKPLCYADMLIRRYPGHVTAYVPGNYSPSGHGQTPAKYGKFAYDTVFAFNVSKSSHELHEAAPDSMLAFVINGYTYIRRVCCDFTVTDEYVESVWTPYDGIKVTSKVIPTESGHRRIHEIESSVECVAYDCGFAVEIDVPGESIASDGNMAHVGNNYASCTVRTGNFGTDCANAEPICGTGEIIVADPNTNLWYPMTRIPAVKYEIRKGSSRIETEVLVTYTPDRKEAGK